MILMMIQTVKMMVAVMRALGQEALLKGV